MGLRDVAGSLLGRTVSSLLDGTAADRLASIQRHRGHAVEDEQHARTLAERAAASPSTAAWFTRAEAHERLDDFDGAHAAYQQALVIDPLHAPSHRGVGNVLNARGELGPAIAAYRRALEITPGSVGCFQDLLFSLLCSLLCSSEASDADVRQWHDRFANQFETPLKAGWSRRPPPGEPRKRLRVGYVCADFRDRVAGRCIAPVLAHHDRKHFDVHCNFDSRLADDFTKKMRAGGHMWHDMARLDDETLARQVRSDRIDILVDVSGHTPGNRILMFARKPAPVQVAYLDYSATTGLTAMDYRLTTQALDPQGQADPFYSEELVRLPGTYWLYNPHPEPPPPDVSRDNGVLFACLNSFYRVSDEALQLWAGILRQVPGSRLALVGVPAGQAQARLTRRFADLGIKPHRIELFGILNHGHFLQLVRATDIALAPFPYNGAMSMLDGLWQGVPCVSLRGGLTFRSRMGSCVPPLVGLADLLADDPTQYAQIAVGLANDVEQRTHLGAELRTRVQHSPLRDAVTLTTAIESAFRDIWRRMPPRGLLELLDPLVNKGQHRAL